MEDRTLTIITDNGEEILCEILFTYYSEEFKKNYVVFVEQGTDNASAAIYYPNEDGKDGKLDQIKSDEEWELLEDLLEQYVSKQDECEGTCSSCDKDCDSRDEE